MRAKLFLSLATLPLRNGYALFFCTVLLSIQFGLYQGRRASQSRLLVAPEIQDDLLQPISQALTRGVIAEHPIPKLMEEAEARFREKLARQSTTLKAAVAEYQRRYKRPPPKGFDAWWKFAQRHDVLLVDEYDGLMEDLEPFWQLSGAELLNRTRAVRPVFVWSF